MASSGGTLGTAHSSAPLLRATYLVLQGHGEGELRGLGQRSGHLLQDLKELAEGHPTHHLVQWAVEQGKRLGRAEGRMGSETLRPVMAAAPALSPIPTPGETTLNPPHEETATNIALTPPGDISLP